MDQVSQAISVGSTLPEAQSLKPVELTLQVGDCTSLIPRCHAKGNSNWTSITCVVMKFPNSGNEWQWRHMSAMASHIPGNSTVYQSSRRQVVTKQMFQSILYSYSAKCRRCVYISALPIFRILHLLISQCKIVGKVIYSIFPRISVLL